MRAVLILNPVSGISTVSTAQMTPEEKEAVVLDSLRAHGVEVEVYHTEPEDTGQALARRLVSQGVEVVIVAGGDGTVHAVAKGLIGTPVALGIIPVGTMNNLAHSLKIPDTVEGACAVIAAGQQSPFDIGQINGQPFLEVAGIGLEAALFTPAEDIKRPGLLSTIRGAVTGLVTLFMFRPPMMRVSFNKGKRRPYHAIQVTICNTPFYGARLRAAPDARVDDGLLDVLVYRNFSKLEYFQHAISISQGRRVLQPKITTQRITSLSITASHPVEIQADGVVIGQTPAQVSIMPGALRVLVPGVAAAESGQASRIVAMSDQQGARK
ncbi:MAG: diacylglycerol kinase family lipid kinase [Ktedonobacteraceae bacterium]|nr:diacylglycerol kinase family lipid kinase [Ktedonobacteraceae bacterium]